MKKSTAAFAGAYLLSLLVAPLSWGTGKLNLSCSNQDGKMEFSINHETSTITFTNIDYFSQANILKNEPFGATIKYQNSIDIKFNYHWYYTASYHLVIKKPITELAPNAINVPLILNGDDSDGAIFNNVKFDCTVLK